MLRSLTIDNFRAFEHFELDHLGRVNLLVGTNNCGKTSVLEAIYLLTAREPAKIETIATPRGELLGPDLDVCHLFHGHKLRLKERFSVRGYPDAGILTAEIVPWSGRVSRDEVPSKLELLMTWNDEPAEPQKPTQDYAFPITRHGGVSRESVLRNTVFFSLDDDAVVRPRVRFVTTEALGGDEVNALLSDIVLTPEEATLIDALKTIEPSIERIASAGGGRSRDGQQVKRENIFVKCADSEQRIPIGTMGDGIWRLLGIALCLVKTRDGILLIDEIDAGLHYTVMEDMWKLVHKTASRLNVQVFATTHSRDCYESLAAISRSDVGAEDSEVSIQRIERGKAHAVAFSEPQIVIAAKRGIEAR